MGMLSRLPWPLKLVLKVAAAGLPYGVTRRLGIGLHGTMDDPAYALAVVRKHLAQTGIGDPVGKVALEIGPGDSVLSSIIGRALGFEKVILVDAGPFAHTDMAAYGRAVAALRAQGLTPGPVVLDSGLKALLESVGGMYLTGGLQSLRFLPEASVDVLWSNAVLEHVPRDQMAPYAQAMARVLKPAGVASHRIDLRDHLAGSLNNLRFAKGVWESWLIRNASAYTNRLGRDDYLSLFAEAGFAVDLVGEDLWDALPLPRSALHKDFRDRSDDALRVRGFDVVLRHARG